MLEQPAKKRNEYSEPHDRDRREVPYHHQVLKLQKVDFDYYDEHKNKPSSPKKKGFVVRDRKGRNKFGEFEFEERPSDIVAQLASFCRSRDAFVQVRQGFCEQRYELTEAISDAVQFLLQDQNDDILSQVQNYLIRTEENIKEYIYPVWEKHSRLESLVNEKFSSIENLMKDMQSQLIKQEETAKKRHEEMKEYHTKMKMCSAKNQNIMLETRKVAYSISANTLELLEVEKTGFDEIMKNRVVVGKQCRNCEALVMGSYTDMGYNKLVKQTGYQQLVKEGYFNEEVLPSHLHRMQTEYEPMTADEGQAVEEYVPSASKNAPVPEEYIPSEIKKGTTTILLDEEDYCKMQEMKKTTQHENYPTDESIDEVMRSVSDMCYLPANPLKTLVEAVIKDDEALQDDTVKATRPEKQKE